MTGSVNDLCQLLDVVGGGGGATSRFVSLQAVCTETASEEELVWSWLGGEHGFPGSKCDGKSALHQAISSL